MEKKIIILVFILLLLISCSSGSKEEENNTVCSENNPTGTCENNLICENGICVDKAIDLGEFSSFNGKFAQVYHFESITRVFGIDTLSKTDTR